MMHSPIPNIKMNSTISLAPRPLDVSGSTGSAWVWAGSHRDVFKFPGSNGSAIIVAVEQPTLSFSQSTRPRTSEWILVPSSSHNAPTRTSGGHSVSLYPSQTECVSLYEHRQVRAMRLCPSGSQGLIATPLRSPGRPMQNPVKSLELFSFCVSAFDCDWRNPKPTPTMALPGRVVRTGPPLMDCYQSLGRFSETRSGAPCQTGQSPSDGFCLLLFSGLLHSQKVPLVCADGHTSNSGQDRAILGCQRHNGFWFQG